MSDSTGVLPKLERLDIDPGQDLEAIATQSAVQLDADGSAIQVSQATFCPTCQLLETYVTTLEHFLASGKELPTQYLQKTTAHLGRRSEFENRAEVQRCPGCRSILKALDDYPKSGEDIDATRYSLLKEIDYEISLIINASLRDVAWASPLSITTAGLPGLHLQPTTKYPPRLELGRLCDPLILDYSMIKKWIACCEDSHLDSCSGAFISTNLGPITPIKYIDLERSCIVALSEPPRYVALSYVWGRVPTLMTTKSNLETLSQPGALREQADQIPKTIRDAMFLALTLGMKYLWVDALCIVQDDFEIKHDHLRGMPFIYSLACFTIAVVSGDNANSGIPGVGSNPEPRSVPPSIILPNKTVPIISSTHHKRLKFLTRMGFVERPTWSRRAWTMQEQMFSKRILLLDGLVSWLCLRTQFREEIEKPAEDPEWAKSNPGDQRYGLALPRHINLKGLGKLVNEYNQRDLSFEEDVLDAFLGISSLHVPIFGRMHFGFPEAFFDYAMCWQPSQTLRPRNPRRSNNASRKLPSWSWMGWHGELDLALWDVFQDHILETFGDKNRLPFLGFDVRIQPLVQWHKICLSCKQKYPISNSYHHSRSFIEAPVGWTCIDAPSTWTNNLPRSYFERNSETNKLLYRYPIIHPRLSPAHTCSNPMFDTEISFRAQRLFFDVSISETCTREFEWKKEHSTVEAFILDRSGVRVGSVTLVDTPTGSQFQACEFLAISSGSCPSRQPDGTKWGKSWVAGRSHPFREDVDTEFEAGEMYEFLNVLWVERREGIAYRRALGRVSKAAWERGVASSADEEKEIDIVLG